jgi:hypothetical protein
VNRINIDRLMAELSAILSEKYGTEITVQAIPKENKNQGELEA